MPSSTAYTFDTLNKSLLQGPFDPPIPGYPTGALDLAGLNEFVGGDTGPDLINGQPIQMYAYLFNASTGAETGAFPTSPQPDSFAYNPSRNLLYCLGWWLTAVNLTTGRTAFTAHGSPFQYSQSVDYDPVNDLVYVVNWTGVSVLNSTSGAILDYIPVHSGVSASSIDPPTHALLVADGGNSTVYVVNLTTFEVSSHFSTVRNGLGYDPSAFLFDPSNQQIYSADQGGDVTVIDARSYQLNSTTPEIYLNGYPNSLALNPLRHEVYVSTCGAAGYHVCAFYDTNDTPVNYTFPNSWPGYVVYDPGSEHLLIYNNNASVYLYDGTNDQPLAFIPLYESYLGGVFDPDNGLDYIATAPDCSVPGSVTVLDPSAHPTVVASIRAGDGPSGVAYDATDHRIFVTNYCGNSVTVIDAANNSVIRKNLPVGTSPYGIAWDPVNDTVFVANENSQNLTVLNASSLATVATVSLPLAYPYGVGVDPVARTVFVTDDYSQAVTVLNATSYAVKVSKVSVGLNPQGVLYDPQNGHVYIANGGSSNVTVLNGSTGAVMNTIATSGGTVALALDPVDHLIFGADAGASRIVVIDSSRDLGLTPSLPASMTPEGVVYVPTTHQVDVFSFGNGAINILANAPRITGFVASPNIDEVGSPFSLSVTATNGTPPYGYSYSGLPTGCATVEAASLVCTPAKTGTYAVTVTVTDAMNYTWSDSVNVTVVPRITSSSLIVTPSAIDLGMSPTFNWSVRNGIPTVHYAYTGMPQGCGTIDRSWLVCTPAVTGVFTIVGTATDSLGAQAVSATILVVNPPPRVVSLTASPSPVPVNSTFVLSTIWTGGTGPWSFEYAGLPPGCPSANASILACTAAEAGNYTVNVTMTDGVGGQSRAQAPVEVVGSPPPPPPPPPRIAGFFVDPSNVTVDDLLTLTVIVTGGATPLTYTFFQLPPGCGFPADSAANFSCRPAANGTFVPQVNVTDALGRSSTAHAIVVVNSRAAVQGSGFSEASLIEALFLGAAAGASAVLVASWVVGRRKRVA